MDESIKNYLARLQTEKMELKSSLREIGFLMKLKPNKAHTRELDRILDRLAYLEKVEEEIRKRI